MMNVSFSLAITSPEFAGAAARIGSFTVLELEMTSQSPSKSLRSSASGSDVSLNREAVRLLELRAVVEVPLPARVRRVMNPTFCVEAVVTML
jgi:hypothetical protein